jgi:hypothetical protein
MVKKGSKKKVSVDLKVLLVLLAVMRVPAGFPHGLNKHLLMVLLTLISLAGSRRLY